MFKSKNEDTNQEKVDYDYLEFLLFDSNEVLISDASSFGFYSMRNNHLKNYIKKLISSFADNNGL
jgi:hypothetical protein